MQKYEKGTNRIAIGRLILVAKVLGKNIRYFLEGIEEDEGVREATTQDQLMCIEVSRNFMKIKNPKYQEEINSLVRSLVTKN